MDYPSIQFDKVYKAVIRAMQLDPATTTLSAADQEIIADDVNAYLRQAWEFGFWPDFTVNEERTVTTTAASEQYCYDYQTGYEQLGHVQQVSKYNARETDYPWILWFERIHNGVLLGEDGRGMATVWVQHRPPVPQFTRTAWSAATAYAVGDLAYYATTGECYKCVQAHTNKAPTDTDYWSRVLFPLKFYEIVRRLVTASQQQQTGDRAGKDGEKADGWEEILRLWSVETGQQRKVTVAAVTVAGGT